MKINFLLNAPEKCYKTYFDTFFLPFSEANAVFVYLKTRKYISVKKYKNEK